MGECIDKTTSDVEELKNNSEKETSDFTDQNSTSDVLNIEPYYSRCMDKKFLGCKWGVVGKNDVVRLSDYLGTSVLKSFTEGKIPVKKVVTRDGKTFTQTFWVTPEELRKLHVSKQKAKIAVAKDAKQELDAVRENIENFEEVAHSLVEGAMRKVPDAALEHNEQAWFVNGQFLPRRSVSYPKIGFNSVTIHNHMGLQPPNAEDLWYWAKWFKDKKAFAMIVLNSDYDHYYAITIDKNNPEQFKKFLELSKEQLEREFDTGEHTENEQLWKEHFLNTAKKWGIKVVTGEFNFDIARNQLFHKDSQGREYAELLTVWKGTPGALMITLGNVVKELKKKKNWGWLWDSVNDTVEINNKEEELSKYGDYTVWSSDFKKGTQGRIRDFILRSSHFIMKEYHPDKENGYKQIFESKVLHADADGNIELSVYIYNAPYFV